MPPERQHFNLIFPITEKQFDGLKSHVNGLLKTEDIINSLNGCQLLCTPSRVSRDGLWLASFNLELINPRDATLAIQDELFEKISALLTDSSDEIYKIGEPGSGWINFTKQPSCTEMTTIGGRLKAERTRLGFTQSDFGRIGGIQKLAQLKYEAGERFPGADYLAAIARTGADILFIVTGVHSTNPSCSDEERLLASFRVAPLPVKTAAIAALEAGASVTQHKLVRE